MTENPSDEVAVRIRDIRKQRKWTMTELAARCTDLGHPEITRSVIENIEGGRPDADGNRRRDITVNELLIIARALGVPWDGLVDGKPPGSMRGIPSVDELEKISIGLQEAVSFLRYRESHPEA